MESVGTFDVTVVREGGDLNVAMQVDYKTEDGSAIAGPDYIEKTGTLYFAAGVTEQKITLEVLDDDVFEEDEHFYCRIRDNNDMQCLRPEHRKKRKSRQSISEPELFSQSDLTNCILSIPTL